MGEIAVWGIKQEQSDDPGRERSWSDLPYGVLCELCSRVYAGDRVVFRSVCRSWKDVTQYPLQKSVCRYSPYLLIQSTKLCHPIYEICQVIDLVHNKPGAIVRVAKDGWLLLTYKEKEMFFYNPITKTTFELPNLPARMMRSMYFSAPPTSKDWIVIVAQVIIVLDEIVIYTIKDGDNEWRTSVFELTKEWYNFQFSRSNAVLYKGLYYFLGENAQILIHDPKKKKFYLHKTNICKELLVDGWKQYMLESDGKLLSVFTSCDGSTIRLFRWNISKRVWETLENFGENKMMFVSDASSMCVRADIRGTSNKIYFPRFMGAHSLFYSLSTKMYHTFEGGSYGDFNIEGSKRFTNSFWFNPQLL